MAIKKQIVTPICKNLLLLLRRLLRIWTKILKVSCQITIHRAKNRKLGIYTHTNCNRLCVCVCLCVHGSVKYHPIIPNRLESVSHLENCIIWHFVHFPLEKHQSVISFGHLFWRSVVFYVVVCECFCFLRRWIQYSSHISRISKLNEGKINSKSIDFDRGRNAIVMRKWTRLIIFSYLPNLTIFESMWCWVCFHVATQISTLFRSINLCFFSRVSSPHCRTLFCSFVCFTITHSQARVCTRVRASERVLLPLRLSVSLPLSCFVRVSHANY